MERRSGDSKMIANIAMTGLVLFGLVITFTPLFIEGSENEL